MIKNRSIDKKGVDNQKDVDDSRVQFANREGDETLEEATFSG